jgi:hypothetical protein
VWLKAHLGRQNVVHGKDVDFGMRCEWCLDFRSNKLGALDFRQLVHLLPWVGEPLERHIPDSAVGADVNVRVIDREKAVFDGSADEAIRLAVPRRPYKQDDKTIKGETHIVSGRRVAATK